MGDEFKTVGVQFFFKDTKDPISFGSKGDRNSSVSFDESQPITSIQRRIEEESEKGEKFTTLRFMAKDTNKKNTGWFG